MSDSPLKEVTGTCDKCKGDGSIFLRTDDEGVDLYCDCTACEGLGYVRDMQATAEMHQAYEEYKRNKMLNQDVPYNAEL